MIAPHVEVKVLLQLITIFHRMDGLFKKLENVVQNVDGKRVRAVDTLFHNNISCKIME
jgi:hypothetical protein